MKYFQRFTALMPLILCLVFPAAAQDVPEMADTMRSNGKIYVVVAVCLTILVGLFIYLYMIDRRITRLEKENKPKA